MKQQIRRNCKKSLWWRSLKRLDRLLIDNCLYNYNCYLFIFNHNSFSQIFCQLKCNNCELKNVYHLVCILVWPIKLSIIKFEWHHPTSHYQIWLLALSVCCTLTVTIGIFPAITADTKTSLTDNGSWGKSHIFIQFFFTLKYQWKLKDYCICKNICMEKY